MSMPSAAARARSGEGTFVDGADSGLPGHFFAANVLFSFEDCQCGFIEVAAEDVGKLGGALLAGGSALGGLIGSGFGAAGAAGAGGATGLGSLGQLG